MEKTVPSNLERGLVLAYCKSQGIELSNVDAVAEHLEASLDHVLPSLVHEFGSIVQPDAVDKQVQIHFGYENDDQNYVETCKQSELADTMVALQDGGAIDLKAFDVYAVQSYKVTAMVDESVTISTSCYHENTTKLSTEELIEEAKGYFEDVDIHLELNNGDFEIEPLQIR